MRDASKYRESVNITAVERALKVMEIIYHADRELGIKEIAAELGEHQSTVYRAVATLVSNGYMYQNPESSKYGLSYKLYMLGKKVEKDSSLIRIAQPYAEKIAEEFKETVNVAVRDTSKTDGYYAITIYQARGNNRALNISESIGVSYECYSCSVGKVLMAFSDDLDMSILNGLKLEPYTEYTISDNKDFVKELENIRICGYGVDNQEREMGLYCVGVPVLDKYGKAVMALSVSGYKNSIKSHGVNNIITSLKEASREMSKYIL